MNLNSPVGKPFREPIHPSALATTSAAVTQLAPINPLEEFLDQAVIGPSLVIKGEVTGSESLYIDGRIEGFINLPGNRVTVGPSGEISANINAREVIVHGKVRGNIVSSDLVDMRTEGSVTGDVATQRISIEDGAFFKGCIDIRKPVSADYGLSKLKGLLGRRG